MSLEDKLAEIDKKNKRKEINSDRVSYEEKLLQYQRDYDIKQKLELDREIQRLKQIELINIRMEEFQKYQLKLQEIREEYDQDYQKRLDNITKLEKDIQNKLNQREKDIERNEYSNRQQYQNELSRLKSIEDDLTLKYKNREEELKIKEKKLNSLIEENDYIRQSSIKRYQEEIEQFKLEFERKREYEKQELANKKIKLEEQEYKQNLFFQKHKILEEDNDQLTKDNKELKIKMKEREEKTTASQKDNDNLRIQVASLLNSEQRLRDAINTKDLEVQHYKEEINTLKHSLETQKKFLEERKSEYGSLIDNLRKQLTENESRNEKIREEYNNEYDRLKKYYKDSIDKEYSYMKDKQSEHIQMTEMLRENLNKYKTLYNKLTQKMVDIEMNSSNIQQYSTNPNNTMQNNFSKTQFSSFNPYSSYPFDSSGLFKEIKTNDYFGKIKQIEKEFEENKFLFRNTFSHKKVQPDLYINNTTDKVHYDYQKSISNEPLFSTNEPILNSNEYAFNSNTVKMNKTVSKKNEISELMLKNNIPIIPKENKLNFYSNTYSNDMNHIPSKDSLIMEKPIEVIDQNSKVSIDDNQSDKNDQPMHINTLQVTNENQSINSFHTFQNKHQGHQSIDSSNLIKSLGENQRRESKNSKNSATERKKDSVTTIREEEPLTSGKSSNNNQKAADVNFEASNSGNIMNNLNNFGLDYLGLDKDQESNERKNTEELRETEKSKQNINISIEDVDIEQISDYNRSNTRTPHNELVSSLSNQVRDENIFSNRTNNDIISNHTKTEPLLNETIDEVYFDSKSKTSKNSPSVLNKSRGVSKVSNQLNKTSNESITKSILKKQETNNSYNKFNNVNYNLNQEKSVSDDHLNQDVEDEEIYDTYDKFDEDEDDKTGLKESIDIDMLKSGSYNFTNTKKDSAILGSSNIDRLLASRKSQEDIPIEENIIEESLKEELVEDDSTLKRRENQSNSSKFYNQNSTNRVKRDIHASSGNNYLFDSKNSKTDDIKTELIEEDVSYKDSYQQINYDD